MIILFGSSGISLSFYFNGLLNLSYAKARRVSLFHTLSDVRNAVVSKADVAQITAVQNPDVRHIMRARPFYNTWIMWLGT